MNLVISMENARKKEKKSISNDVVLMPTELLKAQHLLDKVGSTQNHLNKVGSKRPEHKGKVQCAKNAKGTIPPREPEGSRGAKPSKGALSPESSKKGSSQKRVSGRKSVKPPYKGEVWIVSGMVSDAASNYLVVTSKDSNKTRHLKLGTKHKAEFDHAGNIIKIKVDAKSYPVQNHLVRVPSGVFNIAGSPSVVGKVVGANK